MDQNPVITLASEKGIGWAAYQADCVDFASQLPERSIDFSVYSPPFANLYIYSDSVADMGNCADDMEFGEQYGYLVRALYAATRPGRLSAVHCKNLVNYKGRDGKAGLRDFRGDIIRLHQDAGWAFHSEVTIWKDPVIEMQRTKAHGLLYKQLRADSTFSRQGLAEYLLLFRRWSDGEESDEGMVEPVTHDKDGFPLSQWQEWASPVWMDVRQTRVLNVQSAREGADEKHICPLQLDVIERALVLWSNKGDVVFSPFMGIGSEGVCSVKLGRRFIGTELKESYFRQACGYLRQAEAESATLL